jgi:DNA uptake protein ComE-like DNA-binding protein
MANRLIEQASYFGIDVPHVVEIGERAKQFVEQKLAEPFTFLTRKASGLGRSKIERFYGFVQTKDGDLGELLVVNGLARVHGTRAVRPGSSNAAEEIDKLQKLEEKAKTEKLGAWGISTSTNVPQPTRTVGLPSAAPAVKPVVSPGPSVHTQVQASPGGSATAADGKLDINTATKDDLKKLPGIGEALADRIIAARPFSSADDLKKVKGVGEGKRYEQLRPSFR